MKPAAEKHSPVCATGPFIRFGRADSGNRYIIVVHGLSPDI
nr:MAG TPA: FMRFamide related peptide family [Caudoviricetes sp.]